MPFKIPLKFALERRRWRRSLNFPLYEEVFFLMLSCFLYPLNEPFLALCSGVLLFGNPWLLKKAGAQNEQSQAV